MKVTVVNIVWAELSNCRTVEKCLVNCKDCRERSGVRLVAGSALQIKLETQDDYTVLID